MDDAHAEGSHTLAKESKDAYFQNLYTKPPDFKALALLDPDFAAVYVPFQMHLIMSTLMRE